MQMADYKTTTKGRRKGSRLLQRQAEGVQQTADRKGLAEGKAAAKADRTAAAKAILEQLQRADQKAAAKARKANTRALQMQSKGSCRGDIENSCTGHSRKQQQQGRPTAAKGMGNCKRLFGRQRQSHTNRACATRKSERQLHWAD